jgi:hypothetical protein
MEWKTNKKDLPELGVRCAVYVKGEGENIFLAYRKIYKDQGILWNLHICKLVKDKDIVAWCVIPEFDKKEKK